MQEVRPEVDQQRCTACGACVQACSFEVLKLRKDGASPRGIGRCIVCGHCVAVCPSGAITHASMPQEHLLALPEQPAVDFPMLMQLLGQRRSVRQYTEEPVAEDDLRALVEAAVLAPSGHNSQPWEFTFITAPERLDEIRAEAIAWYADLLAALADDRRREELAEGAGERFVAGMDALAPALQLMVRAHGRGGDRLLWGAPVVALVHSAPGAPAAEASCTYAAANMMLAAVSRQLATCVIGFLSIPVMMGAQSVLEALGLPEGHQMHVAMTVGHPALTYRRSVARREPPITIL